MPAVAAGAALVGGGIAVYGAIKSADDQASLDSARARIALEQASELEDREVANEALRNQTAYRQKLQFGASFAASGRAGTGVGSQLQIQNQTDLQNMISNKETQFQESMLRQQAGIDTTMANQAETAGTINALGAGVGGVSAAARTGVFGGYGGKQSLGAYPQQQTSGG